MWRQSYRTIWPHNHRRERVQEGDVPLPITAFHKFGEGIGNSAWFFIIFIFIIIVYSGKSVRSAAKSNFTKRQHNYTLIETRD